MTVLAYPTKEVILEYPATATEWPTGRPRGVPRLTFAETFDATELDRPVWIIVTNITPVNSFSITIGER